MFSPQARKREFSVLPCNTDRFLTNIDLKVISKINIQIYSFEIRLLEETFLINQLLSV